MRVNSLKRILSCALEFDRCLCLLMKDETLNNLGKMVKEGNGTGRVVEMIRDIAFAIIKGYISRLAETTHLQSHTEPKDQPS